MNKSQEGNYEDLSCDLCGKLIGYGEGDLNCCKFLCAECMEKTPEAVPATELPKDAIRRLLK